MAINKQNLLALVLTLPAGLAIAQSFPPHNMHGFAAVGFGLFCLSALLLTKGLYAGGLGIITGFVVECRLVGFSGAGEANAIAIFSGMGLVLAITAYLIVWSARKMSAAALLLCIPCLAVVVERISWYFFPISMALTQHQNHFAMLYIAPVAGAWGMTWMIWFGGAALALAIATPARWMLILLALVLLTGLSSARYGNGEKSTIKVAAVQAPDPYGAAEETEKLPEDVEYVVWPEQLIAQDDPIVSETAKKYSKIIAASFEIRSGKGRPYNSARLYDAKGQIIGETQKEHRFGKEVLIYRRGKCSGPFDTGSGAHVGVPICFDLVYPDVARKLCARGAQILLAPNSDPDSPGFVLHRMHLALVAIRAAENKVPIVWAEMVGLSTIFDSSGNIIKQLPAETTGSVSAEVALGTTRTLYNRFGDWFVYLCTAAVIAFAVFYGYFRPKYAK